MCRKQGENDLQTLQHEIIDHRIEEKARIVDADTIRCRFIHVQSSLQEVFEFLSMIADFDRNFDALGKTGVDLFTK